MRYCGYTAAILSFWLCVNLAFAEEPELLFSSSLSEVLTPTRLKQRISDVPASVTVIRSETIHKLGIRTVPDALRLVPGMIVGQASGNEYRIGYHGTNGLVPRRMQVLVDGVSVYRTGYAQVGWSEIPVNIDDIEKIEVTRSPSAATYGANSFFGVINIITKHPSDTQGVQANAMLGSLNTRDAMASYSGSVGSTAFRISASHQQDSGFDKNIDDEERRDSAKINRINFRYISEISTKSSLEYQFANSSGDLLSEYVNESQASFPDYTFNDSFFKLAWSQHISEKHRIKVKAYMSQFDRERRWKSCLPQWYFSDEMRVMYEANPDYAEQLTQDPTTPPTGGSPEDDALAQDVIDKVNELDANTISCGDANEDIKERQYDLEFEDTYIFSPDLRVVSGIGLRRDEAESETFLNGSVKLNSIRLFANMEYSLVDAIMINLGGMWEDEESHTDGFQFSPRGAINYHINNNHTVRFVISKAIRTPDMLEYDRDWSYTMRNMDPSFDGKDDRQLYYRAEASGDLVPEEIFSKEISYYMAYPQYNLFMDFKVFEERLTRLISEKLQFFDYDPTNDNSAKLKGAELELNYRFNQFIDSGLTYAYIDNESTNFYEKTLHAQNSGSVRTSVYFEPNWIASLAYYGADSISGFPYNRFDFILSKSILIQNKHHFGARFIIRHYTGDSGFVVDEDTNVENKYDDRTHFYLSLDYSI